MKKRTHTVFLTSLVILLSVLSAMWIVGFNKDLESEVIIKAPAEKVWAVLLDFGKHKDWNPFIKNISGEPIIGKTLSVTLQAPGKDPMSFETAVLVSHYKKELRWKGEFIIPGVFDGEHYFMIKDNQDGTVTLTHGEHFSGILIPFFGRVFEKTLEGFKLMNQALKERSEA